jgi:hypothetical protein
MIRRLFLEPPVRLVDAAAEKGGVVVIDAPFAGEQHVLAASRPILQRKKLPALLVTLPFVGFFLVELRHHKPWQDELNAWGIAVASHNLRILFHYLHYEGHPALWYLLLWIGSRFTHSPLGMTVIEAIIGTAIYLVIGLLSPFSIPEKLLLFLSYFISFEYTVVSRMYGLCLLLALLYAFFRMRHPEKVVLLACLLGLMANTDMVGVILSGALAVEYAVTMLASPRDPSQPSPQKIGNAIAIYLALLIICIVSVWPTDDISVRTAGHLFSEARSLQHLRYVVTYAAAVPLFPISSKFPDYFWGFVSSRHTPLFVIVAVYFIFRRQKNLLLFIGVTATGTVLFFHLIFAYPAVRHFGILFIAFVVALWIQRCQRAAVPRLALLLLGINALAGILAVYGQWHRPFSNAFATAAWIRSRGLENATLLGSVDVGAAGVAEELERPMYFLDCSCTDSFLLFSRRRDGYDTSQVVPRLVRASQQVSLSDAILVLNWPLTPDELNAISEHAFSAVQLAQFTGADVPGEDFFLYRLQKSREKAIVAPHK